MFLFVEFVLFQIWVMQESKSSNCTTEVECAGPEPLVGVHKPCFCFVDVMCSLEQLYLSGNSLHELFYSGPEDSIRSQDGKSTIPPFAALHGLYMGELTMLSSLNLNSYPDPSTLIFSSMQRSTLSKASHQFSLNVLGFCKQIYNFHFHFG